jgi:hypothetical protein
MSSRPVPSLRLPAGGDSRASGYRPKVANRHRLRRHERPYRREVTPEPGRLADAHHRRMFDHMQDVDRKIGSLSSGEALRGAAFASTLGQLERRHTGARPPTQNECSGMRPSLRVCGPLQYPGRPGLVLIQTVSARIEFPAMNGS